MRLSCAYHAPVMRLSCAYHATIMRLSCTLRAPFTRPLHAPHYAPSCAPNAPQKRAILQNNTRPMRIRLRSQTRRALAHKSTYILTYLSPIFQGFTGSPQVKLILHSKRFLSNANITVHDLLIQFIGFLNWEYEGLKKERIYWVNQSNRLTNIGRLNKCCEALDTPLPYLLTTFAQAPISSTNKYFL